MARYGSPAPRDEGKNPLTPFLVAMAVFLLLMVVVVILLVTRLGTARTQIETLTENLNATQQELDAVLAELEAATPVPTPTPTPTPAPTPSPSQSASPEPSEEASPTPTAAPLLKDTITQEVLGDVEMPRDESWFDEAQEAYVSAALTLHVRSGPGTDHEITLILYCNTKVEVLAKQDGWSLIRLEDKYGWVASAFLSETEVATPPPYAAGGATGGTTGGGTTGGGTTGGGTTGGGTTTTPTPTPRPGPATGSNI